MRLSELFKTAKAGETPVGRTEAKTSGESLSPAASYRLNRQIRALVPGQTLQGEVVSIKGNEVSIKIAEDMVLSARLEREIAVDQGKIMTFEVKNNGKVLSLSPLFENMATDGNILKALEMARIPVNEQTVAMTEEMMKQGLSVDKNTLQAVFKDITVNPGASMSTVIQLHQLKLPVSAENLAQMESYKALTHQLITGMTNILEELSLDFQTMIQNGSLDSAVRLYMGLAGTFGAQEEGQTLPANGGAGAETQAGTVAADGSGQMPMESGSHMAASTGTETMQENNAAMTPPAPGGEGKPAGTGEQLLSQVLSPSEMENLTHMLRTLKGEEPGGPMQQFLADMSNGTATAGDLLRVLSGNYSDVDISRNVALADIFGSREYGKALKAEVMKQWTLAPEDVGKQENVDKLYQRLNRQLTEMNELVNNSAGKNADASKSIANLRNNLDFMNQLNQVYTYVQLPLKMSGREAHGELYVYTNKKHLAQSDGNVSALLHLDMEYLGPVDVYVAMQQNKVSTQFYLQSDEMIDFVAEHMHILSERLEKRGYSMSCELVKRESGGEESEDIAARIAKSEGSTSVIAQYSFDVRA